MAIAKACRLAFAAAGLAGAGLAGAVLAGASEEREPVDLELVLAVDISMSMDAEEIGLQRRGYLEAFRSPEVIEAILNSGTGRAAITYLEWAGAGQTRVVVPWTLVDSRQSAADFADRLAATAPGRIDRTSISGALAAAGHAMESNRFDGARRVIDISGDGPNNDGEALPRIRDELVLAGITINGLALMVNRGSLDFGIDNLDEYYRDCVIGGEGAFVLPVTEWSQFSQALKLKLFLEIAGVPPDARQVPQAVQYRPTGEPEADCLIGEAIWQHFIEIYGDGQN